MYFEYGDAEICYLKERDARLAEVIDYVGHIYREADTDLFSSIVHHIIGQQISTKAQATIWKGMFPLKILQKLLKKTCRVWESHTGKRGISETSP